MRIAVYVRVSTSHQTQTQTIEQQLGRLRAHIESQGVLTTYILQHAVEIKMTHPGRYSFQGAVYQKLLGAVPTGFSPATLYNIVKSN